MYRTFLLEYRVIALYFTPKKKQEYDYNFYFKGKQITLKFVILIKHYLVLFLKADSSEKNAQESLEVALYK